MKNFLNTFIFISGLVFFTACKKENSALVSQNEELATQKVKQPSAQTRVKTETSNVSLKTYTYNADHNSLGYTGTLSAVYSYPDTKTIIQTSSPSPETHYDLDNKGLIEKGTSSNSQDFYTYNSKKQLTELLKQFTGGDTELFTYIYHDNNLDTLWSSSNGIVSWYEAFTYYTEQPNVLNNETIGEGFRGEMSKNLMKSVKFHSSNVTYIRNYTYSFDALGRVTKVSSTINGNAQPDIVYTYY